MNKKYLGLVLISTVALAYASVTSSIVPTGAGTYSAWTPSTGATHYTLVDEASCNGKTDYVSTTVNGNRDSYAVSLASIPTGAVITAIDVTPCASKNSNSGSSNMSVFYRLNGSNSADSATYALTGTTPVALSASSYTSLSVTKNASTTLEIGAVLSSGTAGARLSKLATVITYITAPAVPQNVTAVASSSSSLSVNWQYFTSDQDGFSIEKSLDGTNFTFLATTTKFARSYVDGGLASGTYYYRMRAFNVVGYSVYSTTTIGVLP